MKIFTGIFSLSMNKYGIETNKEFISALKLLQKKLSLEKLVPDKVLEVQLEEGLTFIVLATTTFICSFDLTNVGGPEFMIRSHLY